jgi:hypothetical protein
MDVKGRLVGQGAGKRGHLEHAPDDDTLLAPSSGPLVSRKQTPLTSHGMECTSNRSSDADLDDTHTSEELDHRELPPPPSPPSPPSSLPAPDEAVEELCHRLRAVELEHEPDIKASNGPVTRGSRTCELPEEL